MRLLGMSPAFLLIGRIGTAHELSSDRLVLTPDAKKGLFHWKSTVNSEIQRFDIARNDPRSKGIDPNVAELLKLLPDPNHFDIGDDRIAPLYARI